MEHLSEELNFVVASISSNHVEKQIQTATDQFSQNHKIGKLKEVSTDILIKVINAYKDDFEMFGYEFTIDTIDSL